MINKDVVIHNRCISEGGFLNGEEKIDGTGIKCCNGNGFMGIAPAVMADEVEKPEKITVMFDGTVFTQENGQAEFEARWEELTGIDLQIIQPDHSQYYDVLGQTIAGGDWPDVVLLGSTYYASYAAEGVLWDMTEAYDNLSSRSVLPTRALSMV